MEIRRLETDAPALVPDGVVAAAFLDASQLNARVIRLGPGRVLPPHTHGSSDLMLFVVEGEGEIGPEGLRQPFAAGALAHLRGDEELHVANTGAGGLTMLAVLAPPFPPR